MGLEKIIILEIVAAVKSKQTLLFPECQRSLLRSLISLVLILKGRHEKKGKNVPESKQQLGQFVTLSFPRMKTCSLGWITERGYWAQTQRPKQYFERYLSRGVSVDLMQQEALERIIHSVFISNMNQILKIHEQRWTGSSTKSWLTCITPKACSFCLIISSRNKEEGKYQLSCRRCNYAFSSWRNGFAYFS